MQALRHHHFDLETYFELEESSDVKFEFCNGAILAMAGATLQHTRVAKWTESALDRRVGSACESFSAEQRVATGDGVHTYPDAMVVCGEIDVRRHRGTDTVHNPSLLVEVLSPSTREYDLGEKLLHYKTIPSLKEVLLIEPESVDVLHVWRTARGWKSKRFLGIEAVLTLRSLKAKLPLREVYERVG